jgi:1-deoxy-D-xylulose-5-phosphate reductoisomerase
MSTSSSAAHRQDSGNLRAPDHAAGGDGLDWHAAIDLLKRQPERYRIEAVTAGRNAEALAKLARELGARFAAVADPACYGALKDALAGLGMETGAGESAVIEAAGRPADWVIATITEAAGLKPTLAAAERGTIVALANKECLVCAGAAFMRRAAAAGASRCSRSIPSTTPYSRRSVGAARSRAAHYPYGLRWSVPELVA